MGRPIYHNQQSMASFDPEEDNLLRVARAVQAIDTLDQINHRNYQTNLARTQVELELFKEGQRIEQATRATNAHLAIANFTASYDPYDSTSRQKLDWFKSWGAGEGIDGRTLSEITKTADIKNAAMEQVILGWKNETGVDWVTGADGRISVDATRAEHEHRKYLQKEQEATWGPSDHGLFRQMLAPSKDGSVSYTPYEARQIVTESARAKNLYMELVANELYNPGTRNFSASSPGTPPTPGTPTGISPFLPSASYFNYQNFYLDPGVAIAAKHLNRMKLGEVPEFQKDAQGSTVYDSNTGAAIITSWKLNPQRMKEDADARKAEFEATLTAQEANVSPEYKERARLRGATSALEKLDIGGTSTGARDTSRD